VQRENNKEILSELINRKIREHIRGVSLVGMSDEQLKVHVKKIADKVMSQFKVLKGPGGSLILHNCIETTVKALRIKRDNMDAGYSENRESNVEDGLIADYEVMENLLMEKFELCEKDTESYAGKVRDLTMESYTLKKDLIMYRAKVIIDLLESLNVL
jgi:hypothetical protein